MREWSSTKLKGGEKQNTHTKKKTKKKQPCNESASFLCFYTYIYLYISQQTCWKEVAPARNHKVFVLGKLVLVLLAAATDLNFHNEKERKVI